MTILGILKGFLKEKTRSCHSKTRCGTVLTDLWQERLDQLISLMEMMPDNGDNDAMNLASCSHARPMPVVLSRAGFDVEKHVTFCSISRWVVHFVGSQIYRLERVRSIDWPCFDGITWNLGEMGLQVLF